MTLLFFIGVGWLVYVFAGYPVLLAVIASMYRVRPKTRAGFHPSVSVLISARNEEKDIGWKISETLKWEYPAEQIEILVASDASEDRTDAIIQSIKDSRITFLRIENRGGKGRALNRLIKKARGEILFFTDANAHIGPECLNSMVGHFADERVGCVTGDSYSIEAENELAIGRGASVYWSYETLIKRLESRLGSVLVCDGAIFCMRRNLYKPVRPELANDLELPLQVGASGYWILHEPDGQVFERDTNSPYQEFARRRRICAQGALAAWKLRANLHGLRAWQFLSHKVLRWLTLMPLALMFFSSALLVKNWFFAGLLSLQAIFYLTALLGWVMTRKGKHVGRLASIPFYIVLGSLGALVGVYDACRGRRFDVWEIPTLSRGDAVSKTWKQAGA